MRSYKDNTLVCIWIVNEWVPEKINNKQARLPMRNNSASMLKYYLKNINCD